VIPLFKHHTFLVGVICASLAAMPCSAAQDYPDRPIQLVIPYAPGGGTDVLARYVAEYLGDRLGQKVIPDNRPGAGTAIGAGVVARAAPNGYTLLFSTLAHSLNATMNPKLQFDPVNDFEFVGRVGQGQLFIMVNPQYVKVDNLGSLITLMRTKNEKVAFASAGVGSPMHLGGELLKQFTKGDATNVPYKGEAPALADLLGGRVTFMLCSISACGPYIQERKLKPLAVMAPRRSVFAPMVPTTAEAGFPGVELNTWYFIAAPKGTPPAVITRLNQALNEVLIDGGFKRRVYTMGVELETRTTPAGTRALVQSEIDKWRPIIKASGAVVE
jgi:tripartite-type tricarboxylate transporter receptor subunit TctC